MSMMPRRWKVLPPAPKEKLRQYQDMSGILAQVLWNRGFVNPQDAYKFLYTKEIPFDPFKMKGMNTAVSLIRQAIKKKESMVVYGDFDADGVTSTALLTQVLKALGAKVKPYIPHRVDEGYGLNSQTLRKLAREGHKLVVTVDCGIRSVQEVEKAGLDIIITDHHSIGSKIPNAKTVINPQQEGCPGDVTLAGVGVAYMLADALLKATTNDRRGKRENGVPIELEALLDLVAIGTVADIMPLSSVRNRSLVRRGLEIINEARRPGIKALIEVAGLNPGEIQATNIGFALGPRINAAGRLESAMTAYHLLAAADMDKAQKYAKQLQELNLKRQELTRAAQQKIQERLQENPDEAPLIFAEDDLQEGIIGLVAGRLAEEYYRPAVIVARGEKYSRASCRSIPEFHITHALDECAALLVRHGGHAMAAGFTIENGNLARLKEALTDRARSVMDGKSLAPTLEIDAELEIRQLSEQLVEELKQLEPTGQENPAPVFMTRKMKVQEARAVGKEGQHLKLRLGSEHPFIDGIAFRLGDMSKRLPEYVDVAYQLEINEWNGRRSLQLNVQAIRPAE